MPAARPWMHQPRGSTVKINLTHFRGYRLPHTNFEGEESDPVISPRENSLRQGSSLSEARIIYLPVQLISDSHYLLSNYQIVSQ